jgi:hypothetical protein
MVATVDIEIIRGDDFEKAVGLGEGFADVVSNPTNYIASMCLRLDQSDSLPILLQLDAPAELEVATPSCPARVYFQFGATSAETTALPPYDLVHYVELIALDGPKRTRLFQGKVNIVD